MQNKLGEKLKKKKYSYKWAGIQKREKEKLLKWKWKQTTQRKGKEINVRSKRGVGLKPQAIKM